MSNELKCGTKMFWNSDELRCDLLAGHGGEHSVTLGITSTDRLRPMSVETSKPTDLTRFDVTFADKIARHPEGNFMFYAAHISEVERLTKERDDLVWQLNDMQIQRNSEFAKYKAEKKIREAAESKLSQLQLANANNWEWVNKLVAASKSAVRSLGECPTSLEICEAIHNLECGSSAPTILNGGQS